MVYNFDKCKININTNGWHFRDNKILVQHWTDNEYTIEVVADRDEYRVGDIIFNTRDARFDIIIQVEESGLAYLPIGYTFSDNVSYFDNLEVTTRNYPIVILDDDRLKTIMGYTVWGEKAIHLGSEVTQKALGIVPKTLICSECGKAIGINNIYSTYDGNFLCSTCRQLYKNCPRCNRKFKYPIKTKEELCPKCAKRDFVLPYHKYAPTLQFCGGEDDGNTLFLGLEMEVDGGGESNSNVKEIMHQFNPKDKQFLYCMHDGSLRDGLEIISQPATLKYHTSFKGQYARLFEYLLAKGYLAHDTDTCGIHVHFNRSFFKDNEELYISRLLFLVDKFWDEIVKFSRRNQHRIDRYTKKLDRPISTYINQSNKSENHDYHYYAINLANRNTIEFRMFKGSLNIETLMATLQLVNNCVICAKSKHIEELQKMTFEELLDGKSCQKYWKSVKDYTNTER